MAHQSTIVENGMTYNVTEFDHTAQEIDDAVSNLGGASTPQGAIAALGAGVRPNLLVNPFFKINQRNQNSYSSEGYAVDCWRVNSIGTILNVEENGIHLSQPSGSSGAFLIRQDIENSKDLYGKKITLSVLVDSSDSHVSFFVGSRTENTNMRSYTDLINGPGLYTATLLVSQEVDDICVVCRRAQITGEISIGIVAVKLEIGDSQTLAYQDSSGTWNLLERPDPLELVKCKRYLYIIPAYYSLPARVDRNSRIQAVLQTPAKMRIKPTVPSSAYFLDSTGQYSCTLTDADVTDFGVRLLGTTTVQGKGGVLFFATQATISAEL